MKKIKGYKAYNKGLKCNDFQYEVGKEYTHEGKLKICNSGFHFCKNPLDVLNYYNLCDSEFTEVEAIGNIDKDKDNVDTKLATNKIKIGAKLDLSAFIKASFDFLWEKCNKKKSGDNSKLASSGYNSKLASSGYNSKLASSGDNSKLASSGDNSKLASSGDYSKLASSGDNSKLASSGYNSKLELNRGNSVGANIGINGIIKGKKGCWITLAEYDNNYEIKFVLSVKIDGKKVKQDTWYKLENKKLKEIV
ncbi:MAG: hypothetical protein EOL97_13855 [Spirochaetia bacterium]|nr:hypothetical protein [Spirochaetia bacterium]